MPDNSTSTQRGSSSPPSSYRLKLPISKTDQAGYQQALADFAITDLLQTLTTFSDPNFDAQFAALEPQEAEALAALLIQALTASLNGELLLSYLEALRHRQLDLTQSLTHLCLPPPSTVLPPSFPNVELPRFLYGDLLRWLSNGETTDWGIAIGRFYSFAPHRCRWAWCYLIWLDPASPSSAWVTADIAWETDLEPLEAEDTP